MGPGCGAAEDRVLGRRRCGVGWGCTHSLPLAPVSPPRAPIPGRPRLSPEWGREASRQWSQDERTERWVPHLAGPDLQLVPFPLQAAQWLLILEASQDCLWLRALIMTLQPCHATALIPGPPPSGHSWGQALQRRDTQVPAICSLGPCGPPSLLQAALPVGDTWPGPSELSPTPAPGHDRYPMSLSLRGS